MQIHVHIANVNIRLIDETTGKVIVDKLNSITQKLNTMADINEQQFNDLFARIDTSTTRIADRIRSLEEAVKNEGLSKDVEERILAKTAGIADALDAIGKNPETPTPEIPENPETPIETPTEGPETTQPQ